MAKKKKKGRRDYLNAFQKNEAGGYTWEGDVYLWQGSREELRRERVLLGILGAVLFAASAGAGCVAAPGALNCAYVLVPYVVSFVCSIHLCWKTGRFLAAGEPVRAYVYEGTVKAIPGSAALAAAGAGLAALGEILFVCRNGFEGKGAGFLLFLLLDGVVLVSGIAVFRRIKRMKWRRKTHIWTGKT